MLLNDEESIRRQRLRECQRQYHLARAKENRHRLKTEVFSHYCDGIIRCVRCGEDDLDVLQLDHINGGGNRQRRELGLYGGAAFYAWLERNGYPSGYQVLCANCNMRKRITEGEVRPPRNIKIGAIKFKADNGRIIRVLFEQVPSKSFAVRMVRRRCINGNCSVPSLLKSSGNS